MWTLMDVSGYGQSYQIGVDDGIMNFLHQVFCLHLEDELLTRVIVVVYNTVADEFLLLESVISLLISCLLTFWTIKFLYKHALFIHLVHICHLYTSLVVFWWSWELLCPQLQTCLFNKLRTGKFNLIPFDKLPNFTWILFWNHLS